MSADAESIRRLVLRTLHQSGRQYQHDKFKRQSDGIEDRDRMVSLAAYYVDLVHYS